MLTYYEAYSFENSKGSLGVVRTDFGYHVVRVDEKRPSRGTATAAHIMIADKQKDSTINPEERIREIYKKLQQVALSPSEQAEKKLLLRRLTMDLTGLPPTLDELNAYMTDNSPEAYDKVVDRLLSSKGYAERMTLEWLDVARYADSHGFHADGLRDMWPWRDWVIDAYNTNMPYDSFVVWQLLYCVLSSLNNKNA